MKIGIADAGGGMRGIYSAGIYDYCLDRGIHFDLCIGVSAGSGNLLRYLAGQDRISRKFYVTYSFRKDYISKRNILKHGCYVNLDYAYGTLVNEGGEAPLDYDALMADPAEYMAVAADIDSDEARYFAKEELGRNHFEPLMASSSIPLISKPVRIGGHRYYGNLREPPFLPHHLRELRAVHSRHPHVGQHDVRHPLVHDSQGGLAVYRIADVLDFQV